MREIKFRAWHSAQKRMYSAEKLAEDQLTLLTTGKFINVHSQHTELSSIIDCMLPLQYTGLKDKNGVEIYESDIVRAPHDFGPGGFSDRVFSVAFDNELGYQWQYWLMENAEVLGNIHENPELLEKEDV